MYNNNDPEWVLLLLEIYICCYHSILASALSELQWLLQSFREPKFVIVPSLKLLSFNFDLPLDVTGPVVICLVFSALVFILYLVQVLSRLSNRASSSCSSSARASMSFISKLDDCPGTSCQAAVCISDL